MTQPRPRTLRFRVTPSSNHGAVATGCTAATREPPQWDAAATKDQTPPPYAQGGENWTKPGCGSDRTYPGHRGGRTDRHNQGQETGAAARLRDATTRNNTERGRGELQDTTETRGLAELLNTSTARGMGLGRYGAGEGSGWGGPNGEGDHQGARAGDTAEHNHGFVAAGCSAATKEPPQRDAQLPPWT